MRYRFRILSPGIFVDGTDLLFPEDIISNIVPDNLVSLF